MSISRNRGDIRILLLGEGNVGKTTLILSFVTEEFSSQVPAQAEEITIPAEITPERVPSQLVDFSSRAQSKSQLQNEIRRANVICIVCALDDPFSFQQISGYWLPLLRKYQNDRETLTPVVVIGNKLDMVEDTKIELQSLIDEFSEIDSCIECSAKTSENLTEAFWFAQKAVLYPIGPLLRDKNELTVECKRALTRIHRLCDTDNDGHLSDKELEAFQEYCFSSPLTSQSLHDVKKLIRDSCHGGVTLSGVTVTGFLHLHLKFIERGRHETLWTILRKFVPTGCSSEISLGAQRFLKCLFNKFDADQDNCLRPSELENLLKTCPADNLNDSIADLGVSVETNNAGWLTKQGFMAHWVMMAYFEPKKALEYLAYLGFTYQPSHLLLDTYDNLRQLDKAGIRGMFSDSSNTAGKGPQTIGSIAQRSAEALLRGIKVLPDRRQDVIRRCTNRTVFFCRVYGARKVGKTCLCQGLLSRSLKGTDGNGIGGCAQRTSSLVAAYGIPVYNQPRSLIMREIGESEGTHMSAAEALLADVACLMYDTTDPDSFKYVADIYLNYYRGTRVPCIFVAGKSDQVSVPQNYDMDPFDFTAKYGLPDPELFTSLEVPLRTSDITPHGSYHKTRTTHLAIGAGRFAQGREQASPLPALHFANHAPLKAAQNRLGRRSVSSRRSGSAQRPQNGAGDGVISTRVIGCTSSGAKDDNVIQESSDFSSGHQTPTRRSGRVSVDESMLNSICPIYIKLSTMANFPHLKGLQVARTDYAWKMGFAATVLAGFGFVVFRMTRGHF
ncbi:Mitochondrial Rho GTPase 2 [Cichlidogyrus casuarinus]|uniref:Mitochondrial Rho GTPase 2 n=1 Tax=Cichlidogyrus casuarinus TaxID=1844966 RepID=A0ABD2Q8Z2_9PLAT